MRLIRILSCFFALLLGMSFMFCYAEGDEDEIFDPSIISQIFKMQKNKGLKHELVEVIIRKSKGIQIIVDPKLITRLREEIKELIYYDDPNYCSVISYMMGDCSVVKASHHFFINRKPTAENIRRAKIIIKNALLRMGYTRAVWIYMNC